MRRISRGSPLLLSIDETTFYLTLGALLNLQVLLIVPAVLLAWLMPTGCWAPSRADSWLAWLLFLPIGAGETWAAVLQWTVPMQMAASIGWIPSQFQQQLAFAELAIGVTGLLAVGAGQGFRSAAALMSAIFLFGSGVVRVAYATAGSRVSGADMVGLVAVNLGLPVVLTGLLWATTFAKRKDAPG
jgi:hypothetical protein